MGNLLKAKWQGIPIILIVAILSFIPFFSGNSAIDLTVDWLSDASAGAMGGVDYNTEMSLTSVTSGVTENNDDPHNVILTVTSADLNSANVTPISCTVNLDRIDKNSDVNSAYPVYTIEPTDLRSYSGWTTPGTTYYSTDYSTSTSYYNVTIDGKSVALSNVGVTTTVQQGTTDTAIVTFNVDDYTTYDAQLVQDNYDSATLAGIQIKGPDGQVEHTVKLIFLKD